MSEIKGKDLTQGNIFKQMISFSIPMLIGYFLYTGYSIINTIWVGNLLGEEAVAATAESFIVTYVLISLATGATTGTSVLISQYFGAKDNKMVEKVTNNSYYISILVSVVVTILSIAFSDSILRIMNTPESVFPLASGYLKINLAGFVFMYIFFLVISILRGIGDTMTVMIFLLISTVFNAILDPVLIMGLGPFPKLGLNGAAYASLVSQGIAVIFGLIYTGRKNPLLSFNPTKFIINKEITFSLIKIGLPSMMQQTLMSMGIGFVASFVNAFGSDTVAAYGIAIRVDSLVTMVAMSLGASASALTGQNLGANKPERVKEVFNYGIVISVIAASVITLAALLAPKTILSIFIKETHVLEIGASYLRVVGLGYILVTATSIPSGIFNGAGKTLLTMIFTLSALWIIRVPLAAVLSGTGLGSNGIWAAILVSNICGFLVNVIYYYRGKWLDSVSNAKGVTAN